MRKILSGIILAAFVLVSPVSTFADTTTTTASAQVQALMTQVQNLQTQIKAMQVLQTQVQTAATGVVSTLQLIRNLREGMTGADVTALQTILAADPTIYPEGTVTGYYGRLTSQALKKFQKKYGIEAVGFVGPKTLKKLNEVIKELGLAQEKDNNKLCIPLGHTKAPGWIKKMGAAAVPTDLVPLCNNKQNNDNEDNHQNNQATTTPAITNTASASVVVGGSISDTAHLTSGNNPTGTISFNVYAPIDTTCTTPLTPALPLISISGNGNYSSAGFVTSAVGMYRFIASYSGDLKNLPVHTICNAPGSTVSVTAVPDTTAPVISGVSTSNLLGTTTSIVWTTNEVASSKVWFGITSPISTSGAPNITNTNLVTSHSVPLTGLSTSTTYYFVVGGADGSANTSTSIQSSFVTTAGL